METRCKVCGCITDSIELSSVTLSGKSFDVCPYCLKELNSINDDPVKNANAARKLLSTNANGKRDPECSAMLYRHFYSLGIEPQEKIDAELASSAISKFPAPQNAITPQTVKPQEAPKNTPAPQNKDLQAEVEELKAKVEEMSSSLKKFKRRYYLSRIFGVIAPVLLTLIMLLIFLKMGFLDKIFEYYDFLGKYASM